MGTIGVLIGNHFYVQHAISSAIWLSRSLSFKCFNGSREIMQPIILLKETCNYQFSTVNAEYKIRSF